MSKLKVFLFILRTLLLGILGGVLFGGFFLFFLTKLPLSFDNKLNQIFGIKKPQIIGFQPFWLLKKADRSYRPFINTFTYFGLTLDSDGTILKLVNPQEEEPGWTTLRLKSFEEKLNQAKKSHLKLSLLVHQSDEASISALLENPKKHAQNLINDAAPLMKKYGFTDFNLDIESFKKASESAQQKMTAFVKEVKKGANENNLGTLTVEVNPTALIKPQLIDAEEIGKIADFLVLMAYDFHYINSYLAGPVAPVGGVGKVREYDVEQALKELLNIVPKEKIILGIPLYGYEWETLSDAPGAPTIPGGGSTASHRRVSEFLISCDNCRQIIDDDSKQPYVIFPEESFFHQIYYENEQSLKEKLALVKKYKIAGIALWALGYEGENILDSLREFKKLVEWVR